MRASGGGAAGKLDLRGPPATGGGCACRRSLRSARGAGAAGPCGALADTARRRRRFVRSGAKTQHDVHAVSRRIVFGCLFPEKIDRFAKRGIAKFNMRNDDAVHLVGHLRRAAQISSRPMVDGRPDSAVFSDWLLPGFLYFPKLAGPRLVVRFFAVLVFGVVDFFLSSTRRGVVRIKRQHLVVTFHRLVVLAGLIKAVGFGEQRFTSSTLLMKPASPFC